MHIYIKILNCITNAPLLIHYKLLNCLCSHWHILSTA